MKFTFKKFLAVMALVFATTLAFNSTVIAQCSASGDCANIVVRGKASFLGRPVVIIKKSGTGDIFDVCSDSTCAVKYFSIGSTGVIVVSGGIGAAQVEAPAVTITATNVRLLHTTPVSVIASPAAGYANIVDECRTLTTYGTAAFTGANNVEFRYTDGSGDKVTADLPSADLDISSGTKNYRAIGASVIPVNAAVVAVVPTADPGGNTATGTLKIVCRYHVSSLS